MRLGPLLSLYSLKVSNLDLKPGWGDFLDEYRDQLFVERLQDIDKIADSKKYDLIFGNWMMSYLKEEDIIQVLRTLKFMLN